MKFAGEAVYVVGHHVESASLIRFCWGRRIVCVQLSCFVSEVFSAVGADYDVRFGLTLGTKHEMVKWLQAATGFFGSCFREPLLWTSTMTETR